MFLFNSYTKFLSSKTLGWAINYNVLLIISKGCFACYELKEVLNLPSYCPLDTAVIVNFISDETYVFTWCIMNFRDSVTFEDLTSLFDLRSIGTS
jgi:hypothetical protein